jgi:hypothetical protein
MPSTDVSMGKKDRIGRWLLTGWAMVALVVVAALSVKHLAPLPEPDDAALLTRAALPLRRSPNEDFLVHVIYADCSCARALFSHLVARGPFPGAEELILFVGADAGKQAAAERSGFEFTTISAQDLATRFGLEAAPVLIMFNRAGKLRYAGGYYAHPATIHPMDERLHAQLAAAGKIEPLPVFGCAVSARLQKALDPLNLDQAK